MGEGQVPLVISSSANSPNGQAQYLDWDFTGCAIGAQDESVDDITASSLKWIFCNVLTITVLSPSQNNDPRN